MESVSTQQCTHLWVHYLHNNCEENSKPGLSKEIVEDEAAKSPWWREVQGAQGQGRGDQGAGREQPQARGKTKELYQSGKKLLAENIHSFSPV